MITRAYLSIGDVLTLLREEFPDVTISKIRFLESQGLVNPERSPSGYRKFYEQDVERLRWVLRQQREHFLPLKVIRDRLAQEDGETVEDTGPPEAIAALLRPATAATAAAGNDRSERGNGRDPVAHLVRAPTVADTADSSQHRGERPQPAPPAAPRPSATGGVGGTTPPSAPLRPTADAERRPTQRREPPASAPASPSTSAPVSASAPSGSDPSTSAPAASSPPRQRHQPAQRDAEPTARVTASAGVSGASMTLDELCAASGLAPTEIASLEGFGLIEGVPVGGVLCYDEEALVVAKLVAEFGRYGIEPRHLRLYRNAVEREVGLIEQIVTPLLRQRNPEARQRAVDATGDLARLGEGLRSSLLRREMRRLLGH